MATIPLLSKGEPIDYDRINQIISAVNEVNTAGALQGVTSFDTTYYSTDDNMVVQAFRRTFRPNTSYVYSTQNGTPAWNVTYPVPFSISPIVVVTFTGSGSYHVPYTTSIGTRSFKLGVIRIGHPYNTATLKSQVYANIIAMGPHGGLPE